MNKNAENLLQKIIFPDLENGRPQWDKPHTEAVVSYITKIMDANSQLQFDREVLTIAAYAHDWGYSGLFSQGKYASEKAIQDQKKAHMIIGAKKIAKLLQHAVFNYLSQAQKDRIVHLVSIHDKLASLTSIDELILMEADTLAATDSSAVQPTFNKKDYQKWLVHVHSERIDRFITDYSKHKVIELLQTRKIYYDEL